MCPPCLRTPVHYLSGLYRGEREAPVVQRREGEVRRRAPTRRPLTLPSPPGRRGVRGKGRGGGVRKPDQCRHRSLANDPELEPPTRSLVPLLNMRDIRRKLGLTEGQLAKKLQVAVATLRDWEHGRGQTDPALQALLRVLDKLPEPALRAFD
jgi:putative transcriptional regulator